ncbi:hypothetical protein D9758_006074 [Tetrapyrgos nigripes]|uniref:Uncharacterized protein n=1 Tax=Tetrapyrgos nigripes TaxID=182062 RepID=A0A8H5D8X1_9AGAR|nr:hypothetical protein D9758_006074 [Tetrapyrgos nigripes]
MPSYDSDVFSSESQYLSASSSSGPRRSPSRQSVKASRSNASLHGSTMDDDAANGRFSLAHELAAALLPEPSAGSRLLAEEFGIEYDEGAEGIDEDDLIHRPGASQVDGTSSSLAGELGAETRDTSFQVTPEHRPSAVDPPQFDPVFGSPTAHKSKKPKKPEQDAMDVLAQNLESTDKFLAHLRYIDNEPGASTSLQPNLEKVASDIIRRLNDTARDREGQLRELLEYEREFRKIAGEVGGNDVLGQLEELVHMTDLSDEVVTSEALPSPQHRRFNSVTEEDTSRLDSQDWEIDQRHHLDSDEEEESEASPVKDTFPPPPPLKGPPTPATTIPQLTHFRTFTTSLVSSLTTLSEQAQVNGAATADAGRKIRALKNKIGTWRAEWDSAERSRIKVERWEAGLLDGTDTPDENIMSSPSRPLGGQKRIDGRQIVQEHLQAFELALADAGTKTQAIMASG